MKIVRSIFHQILSGGKVVEGECTTFFWGPKVSKSFAPKKPIFILLKRNLSYNLNK